MSDRWGAVRQLAAAERTAARAIKPSEGADLVRRALRRRDVEIYSCIPSDPLLCGAKGVCDAGYVAYDRSLRAPQITWVLAHELGHVVLHGARCQCAEPDLNEEPMTERLPYGAGAIDVYNPRQQRELEANVFAAAFVLPHAELRERFLAGMSFEAIAEAYGTSPTATLSALADALLWSTMSPAGEQGARAQVALDPAQRAAAEATSGPVLVDAGPGTGKTRTLVARVRHLLAKGIPPDQILAITFSNRAAGELRGRLLGDTPEHAHALTICTFHALCLEVLRRHHTLIDLPADFTILDEIDAAVLLERNAARLPLKHYLNIPNPGLHLKVIVKAIGRAKDELVGPEGYARLAEQARVSAGGDDNALLSAAKWAEVADVYAVYEALLHEHGAIDFGGLVMRTVMLLRERPDVLSACRSQWRHVLVDEYQDMNRASGRLLQLLAGDGQGLWVVGDVRQAIYRFRGASPANITNFAEDFPGGRSLTLDVNYRSDPRIVALLSAVGDAITQERGPAPLRQSRSPGDVPPRIWEAVAEDDHAEAAGIATEILRRQKSGRPFRDQAVLVRTHDQAQAIVGSLDAARVPTLYLGDLFVREEVRDLLALMSLAAEGDGTALLRVGATPEHAMARADRVRLVRLARDRDVYFPVALELAAEADLPAAAVDVAHGLLAALRATGWSTSPWHFLARYLFGHGGLVRRLAGRGDPQATQQLMALGQLLALARAFAERPLGGDSEDESALRAFLRHVRRLVRAEDKGSRTPPGGEDLDAVRVLTVHSAKGLEFPVVYVTNLAERRFPGSSRPNPAPPPPGLVDGDDGASEAETLFFVAISRAKQELVLTRATRYGKTPRGRSPLFALVDPFFDAEPPERLSWPARPAVDAPDISAPSPIAQVIHVAETERYLRCPRQYEYRHVFGLREQDEILGYKRFQQVVHLVLSQLREWQRDGNLGNEGRARDLLANEWRRGGPEGHAYENLYRNLAETIVCRSWQLLSSLPAPRPWRTHVDIEVGGAWVRIPIDASNVDSDGTIRISRIHARAPKDGDRTARPLALLRAGASSELGDQGRVTITLEYPATGETIEVKESKRYEEQRIKKLAEAVAGITEGRYPARPDNPWTCHVCPYWMVCPA